MSQQIELVAEARADVGKGASRRLRRNAAMVPGIVYGGGEAPVNISLIENDLSKAIQADTFFSQILALKLGGARSQVLARDMQRHPATNKPMHIDFQRILANQEITVQIPLHFINEEECIGVKDEKGLITPPHHRSGSDLSAEGSAGSHRRGRGSAEDRRHPAPLGSEAARRRRARRPRRSVGRRAGRAERGSGQRACVDARSRNGCDGYRRQRSRRRGARRPSRRPKAKRRRTPTKAEPWPRCVSSWAWEIQARDTTALPTMSAPSSSRRSQRDSASRGPMSRSSRGVSDADRFWATTCAC